MYHLTHHVELPIWKAICGPSETPQPGNILKILSNFEVKIESNFDNEIKKHYYFINEIQDKY